MVRVVASAKSADGRGTGHAGLESGRLEIHTAELRFHLTVHRTPDGRAQKSSHGHGVGPGHLLQDGDEKADLYLSGML